MSSPALNLFLRAGTHAGEELIVRFAGDNRLLNSKRLLSKDSVGTSMSAHHLHPLNLRHEILFSLLSVVIVLEL